MRVVINDKIFKVKVRNSPREIERGMMYKTFDSSFNGMLFVMNSKEHSFWMKNCIIPLDIIFINGDKITKIHHNCPPCEDEPCKAYNGRGNYALELKGGTCKNLGIKTGDIVSLPSHLHANKKDENSKLKNLVKKIVKEELKNKKLF
jgi:uncharacterized membrane protein (UPF0127 family)